MMTIVCSKSPTQIAQEIAKEIQGGVHPEFGCRDGAAVLKPQDVEGFWEAWDASYYPLVGRDGWARLWKKFSRSIPTDEQSVHHGASLPDGGVAVLTALSGEYAIVLQQWIDDRGWWLWHWQPLLIVAF